MGVSGLFTLLLTCLLFFPTSSPGCPSPWLPQDLQLALLFKVFSVPLSVCFNKFAASADTVTMKAWPRCHWSLSDLCLVRIMKLFTKERLIPTFHFLIVRLCWVWLFDKDVCQKSHLVLHVPVSNLTAHSAFSHTNTSSSVIKKVLLYYSNHVVSYCCHRG